MPAPDLRPILRFAPSPNGRLHLGHAYSALLNQRIAERLDGTLLLRIEDIDPVRSRPELITAIEMDLDWLGLRFDGPVLRQSERLPLYAEALTNLAARGLAYPCFCSRRDIADRVAASGEGPRDPDGTPLYPGTCRALAPGEAQARCAAGEPHTWRLDMGKALASEPGPHSFRCFCAPIEDTAPLSPRAGRGPNAPRRAFGERRRSRSDGEGTRTEEAFPATSPHLRLPPRFGDDKVAEALSPPAGRGNALVTADPSRWGDAVIARRDVPTSYHLSVVLDDHAQGITHVVRGEDLEAATDLHVLLQRLLGVETPAYHHHALIRADDGQKLAKSKGSESLEALRARGVTPAEIRSRFGFA